MGDGKSYASLRGDEAVERARPGVPVPVGASYGSSSWIVSWTRTEADGPERRERWPGTNLGLWTVPICEGADGSRLSCRRSSDRRDGSVAVESEEGCETTDAFWLKTSVGGRFWPVAARLRDVGARGLAMISLGALM